MKPSALRWGEAIRLFRTYRGATLEGLARQSAERGSPFSASWLSKIERGRGVLKARDVELIAILLDVPAGKIEWLAKDPGGALMGERDV